MNVLIGHRLRRLFDWLSVLIAIDGIEHLLRTFLKVGFRLLHQTFEPAP